MIQTPNGIFKIDPEDCYIRNHMMSGRVFEHHIINGPIKPHIEKSKYIVDVGANIGCHCISYANMNPQSEVYAFEPQKKLFDILSTNIELNKLSNVKLFDTGLSHTDAESELASLDSVEDKRCFGWNKGGLRIGKGGEKIKLTTLDSMNLPGLDFMKIDVEGAEGLVIMGAKETIKKFNPVIVFEHNYQRIEPTDVGLKYIPTPFEELVKLGYKRFEYIDWDNYIAIPESRD